MCTCVCVNVCMCVQLMEEEQSRAEAGGAMGRAAGALPQSWGPGREPGCSLASISEPGAAGGLPDSGQAGPGLEPGQGGANDHRGAPWACLSPPAPQCREEVWQEAGGGGGRRAVSRAVGGCRLSWPAKTVHRASQRGAGSGHVGPAVLLPPAGPGAASE